jgi:lipid II:glycine glycyltransferase (peptidoglycan interpeptide bridge formation enzyme)
VQVRTKIGWPRLDVVRVERLGATVPGEVARHALAALTSWVKSDPHVMRLDVELFAPDQPDRERIGSILSDLGYAHEPNAWGYARTLRLDLRSELEEIFATFPKKVRRDVRKPLSSGCVVRPIDDPGFADRMAVLMEETMARTGGRLVQEDWTSLVTSAQSRPGLCRVVGLFDPDVPGVESLLAFAVGQHDGDHATYGYGASTRRLAQPIPLAYALIWDLIGWAHACGASWFDLGGVTPGQEGDPDDPLGGISDFKRYFATDVVAVGQAWYLLPRSAAGALGAVARVLRR